MVNSNFTALIYRIIGKPDRWHEDYIEMMHQIIDETTSFEDPDNFSELAIGDEILSNISETNDALAAFGSLLDRSRFKMIILDDDFKPIYHNKNAATLFESVLCNSNKSSLKPTILAKTKLAAESNAQKIEDSSNSNLSTIDSLIEKDDQVYLRTIENQNTPEASSSIFYLMLAVDHSCYQNQLNRELISRYEITEKEETVLLKLIHGKTIKDICAECFISENTVKSHLKSIFRKTSTNSQASVIHLVLTHESQILDSYFGTSFDFKSSVKKLGLDKSITLQDGLNVSYREYGPDDGYPMILCHNGFGCRLSIPNGFEKICERTHKRIIIPDRPGFGCTPFKEGHPQQWHLYLDEFINALGLQQYDLIGNVLGSCIALVFAEKADSKLQRLRLTSPVFINKAEDEQYLTGIFAPSVRLVKASKRFSRKIYELWLKSVKPNISTHYRSMVERSIGSAERSLFEENDTVDLLISTFREGIRNSSDGIANEMVFCLAPRELDLNKISCPVDLWWGTEDMRINRQGVESLAAQLPKATLNIREGYSEHIYFSLFEEIIS